MYILARETESQRMRKKKKNDPTVFRGTFGDLDTFERKTPTVKLRHERKQNKYKVTNWDNLED
jgi:hypothetical protein